MLYDNTNKSFKLLSDSIDKDVKLLNDAVILTHDKQDDSFNCINTLSDRITNLSKLIDNKIEKDEEINTNKLLDKSIN
jgi:hypothetical protein